MKEAREKIGGFVERETKFFREKAQRRRNGVKEPVAHLVPDQP